VQDYKPFYSGAPRGIASPEVPLKDGCCDYLLLVDRAAVGVIEAGFDAQAKEKSENLIRSFREYIEQHMEEIEVLQILYSRPYKQRLTAKALSELEEKLKTDPQHWTAEILWHAYQQSKPDASLWNRNRYSSRSRNMRIRASTNGLRPIRNLTPMR